MQEPFSPFSDNSPHHLRSERRSAARLQVGWWYALLVVFFGLGFGTGYLVWGRGQASTTAVQQSQNQAADSQTGASATTDPNAPQQVTRYSITEDDDPSFGPADAPITIIEFSDYQCPYCQKWHDQVWPKLQEAFPGKIRLVYRDFPLYSIHSNAGPAAEAADCAGDQNKYWEYHDLLFSGQNELGPETYQLYASNLGLDINKFTECVESKKYEAEVNADYTYAAQLGIQSTPTFFVNGVALIGAQPFEVFQKLINQELAGNLTN